jgi:hypothetical protein
MLSIYIYGPKQNGWLNIAKDTVLDMEEFAEAFDEELNIGTYSLPGECPWTDDNRQLLGYSERLENFNTSNRRFKCDVYDGGFPEMQGAQFTILEKKGKLSYTSGSFTFSISGSKGLFGSAIKGKKLADLSLGGPIIWAGYDSRGWATQQVRGAFPQYDYFSFAPVAIENFINKDRPDFDNEFLAKDTVNNVMVTGSGPNDWEFGRPQAAAPTVPAVSGTAEYLDFRTVPFFKTKFILKKIFEENGFAVSGAIVDGNDFDHLYDFNNYAIEYYIISSHVDINRGINPKNHMPDILIKDWLQGIFSLLNIYPSFANPGEVKLLFRDSIFTAKKIYSITNICSPDFSSTIAQEDTKGGYKLNYSWDSNDAYYSERVKEITGKTLVATVATRAALDTLSIFRALTTDDVAYVEADNMYYAVANATGSPILWDAFSEELPSYVFGGEERSVDIGVSTLCTYVEFDVAQALFLKRNKLGTRQPGSYRNNRGAIVLNAFAQRVFYINRRYLGTGVLQPVSYNHNRDAANTIIEPYSLAFKGVYGLAQNFHARWQAAKENMEIVKSSIMANTAVITQLKACNTIEMNNILLLPYKIEKTIPLQPNVQISMSVI